MTEDRSGPEMRFARHMSDAEALMWNVEKDPWLNPNGAVISLLDQPPDAALFTRRLRYAVANIPRLRERVIPGWGRLTPPTWATDGEFDFGYHVRHVSLPEPGSIRQLYDLATRLYEDPFDRTRPLWQFVIIDGIEPGRGAVFWKVHHTISDGIGLISLFEEFIDASRQATVPPEVDLDRVIAEARALEHHEGQSGTPPPFLASVASAAGRLWRLPLNAGQRAVRDVALLAVDPLRVKDWTEEAVGGLFDTVDELRGGGGADVPGGSPLWRHRSRRRHLESLRMPLADAKAAGQALGGSVNDLFVAGAVLGALIYHDRHGASVDALNISFVVNTRAAGDTAAGGNSFAPTRVQVPGGPMTPEERFRVVRDRLAARRASTATLGAFAGLAGLANLLPTSIVTRVARSQVTRMDFATSNLRAPPIPLYISGAEILENIIMGPVAGTAFNLTAISYNGSLDLGVFIDPAAVEDPGELRDCLAAGYDQLLGAGAVAG
jgi:WS/DGAT/MGAT family acyltransferase